VNAGTRSSLSHHVILPVLLLPLACVAAGARTSAQATPAAPVAADSSRAILPGRALLRSAIVPGWGQAYVGHYGKAGILFGGAVTTVGLALRADGRVGDLTARRPLTPDPIERDLLESDIEHWRSERRRWILWSAAVWIYSMLDAYVDAQLHDFDAVEPAFTVPPANAPGIAAPRFYLGLKISLDGGRY
jgi:hypothetical protein